MDTFIIFAQTSPHFFPIYSILFGLLGTNLYLIILGCLLYSNAVFNKILKKIFKHMYETLNMDSLPLLGKGIRPKGAINCGSMPTLKSYTKLSKSYGMPSGHSQTVWFLYGFALLYLIKKFRNNTFPFKHQILNILLLYTSIILFLVIGIYISRTRVIKGCHTINQVVFGGLIGFILGCIGFIITDYVITRFSSI